MAISKSKKRYMVSLTPSVVERFQMLAKDVGLPSATVSNICEDALKQASELFQIAKDKGSFDISDLQRLVGQQLELLPPAERSQIDVGIKRKDSKVERNEGAKP